jgi:hypothetical protein
MVKRILIFCLVILPALFSLTTCDLFIAVFSLSPFPGYLAQVVASVDMREEVETFLGDGEGDWRSDVFVLKNSVGVEGVFLIVRRDSGGQWVYVFNPSLTLIDKSFIDMHSDIHLVDANQNFLVGNILFNGADLRVAGTQPSSLPGYWGNPAFSDGSSNYVLRTNDLELRYDEFGPGWASTGADQLATTTGSSYYLQLKGAGVDGFDVYLFLHGYDSTVDTEVLRIMVTPQSHYSGSFSGSLIPTYETTSRPVRRIEWEARVYYTRKGIVAMNYSNNHLLLKPNGDRIKLFYVTSEREPALDFDIDGEYYYIFDEQNFRLYQAATGF